MGSSFLRAADDQAFFRQDNSYFCADSKLALEMYFATMQRCQRMHQREPQPGAFTLRDEG